VNLAKVPTHEIISSRQSDPRRFGPYAIAEIRDRALKGDEVAAHFMLDGIGESKLKVKRTARNLFLDDYVVETGSGELKLWGTSNVFVLFGVYFLGLILICLVLRGFGVTELHDPWGSLFALLLLLPLQLALTMSSQSFNVAKTLSTPDLAHLWIHTRGGARMQCAGELRRRAKSEPALAETLALFGI
jgi:hypothetical protein